MHRRLPYLFVILLVLSQPGIGWSQIDTEFWFAAPSLSVGHGDRPIMLRFTTFESPAHITISQPANPDFAPIEIDVLSHASRSIDLSWHIDRIENWPGFQVLDRGLLITSDHPITAYYEVNHPLNPDIFSLKGRNALGKNFLIPAQNYWGNATIYEPSPNSSFDIVATSNDTRITIIPYAELSPVAQTAHLEIELDRGETYSVVADGSFAGERRLTGTEVIADQLISITLKDDSNENGFCHDLGGDQLVPVDVLGTEYIAVRGFLSGGDKVFVMATEDNTEVIINGRESDPISIDRLEMHRHDLFQQSAYIKASKPIYVLHATGFGCEIGLALLPKIECTGSQSVSFTRSTDEEFGIILITAAGNETTFRINDADNVIFPSDFDTVPGTDGNFVAGQINLTHRIGMSRAFQIKNHSGSFHLGIINGGNRSGCRYGYFSDFKTLKILSASSKICKGLSVTLLASGSDQYTWFGDGITSGTSTAQITVSPDTSTTYAVTGSDQALGCLDTAYLNVEVFDWPQPEISISQPCFGEDIQFHYVGDEELQQVSWILDQDTVHSRWRDTILFSWDNPGWQSIGVVAKSPAGCTATGEFEFQIGGIAFELDSVHSVTRGDSLLLSPVFSSGDLNGSAITWSPAEGLSCQHCLETVANPLQETRYQLQVTDSAGCVTTFETLIFVNAPVFIPNAFSPNGDGINDLFEIYTEDVDIHHILIVNRWGQKVFEGRSNESGWDGRSDGRLADPGVYIYTISGRHHRSFDSFLLKGEITLIR